MIEVDRKACPSLKVLGATATPDRHDGRELVPELAGAPRFDMPTLQMLEAGKLVPPRTVAVSPLIARPSGCATSSTPWRCALATKKKWSGYASPTAASSAPTVSFRALPPRWWRLVKPTPWASARSPSPRISRKPRPSATPSANRGSALVSSHPAQTIGPARSRRLLPRCVPSPPGSSLLSRMLALVVSICAPPPSVRRPCWRSAGPIRCGRPSRWNQAAPSPRFLARCRIGSCSSWPRTASRPPVMRWPREICPAPPRRGLCAHEQRWSQRSGSTPCSPIAWLYSGQRDRRPPRPETRCRSARVRSGLGWRVRGRTVSA